jgi:hypothetical protein
LRSVTVPLGARSRGLPLASNPSITWTLPRNGMTFPAGASSDSLPRSTSCIAAVPVIALVIEAIHTTVSGVIEAGLPISRTPKAPS